MEYDTITKEQDRRVRTVEEESGDKTEEANFGGGVDLRDYKESEWINEDLQYKEKDTQVINHLRRKDVLGDYLEKIVRKRNREFKTNIRLRPTQFDL